MADTQALARLFGLQSPSNLTPTASPYLNKRRAQIVSGEDELAPSELEQLTTQQALGNQGLGVSRDTIRDAGIQQLKQRLGLITAEAQAKQQGDIATERIKGQYAVQAATEAAKAAEARRAAGSADIAARQEVSQQSAMERLAAMMGGRKELQTSAQEFKSGQVSSTALSSIARERQHLADEIRKAEPNMLGRLIGRTNARQPELDTFDAALEAAQKIAAQFPDVSAEEGLMRLGETGVTPDEIGQVQKLLLMLRGR